MRRAGLSLMLTMVGWLFVVPPASAQARITTDPPISGPDTRIPIGTRFTVSGSGCDTDRAFVILVVNIDTPNERDEETVEGIRVSGGRWTATITVPPEAPVNQKAELDAGCGTPEDVKSDYDLVQFTVVPSGDPAPGATTTAPRTTSGPTTGTTARPGGPATTGGRSPATTTRPAGGGATSTTVGTTTTSARTTRGPATGQGGGFASTGARRVPWVAGAVALLALGQCLTLLRQPR